VRARTSNFPGFRTPLAGHRPSRSSRPTQDDITQRKYPYIYSPSRIRTHDPTIQKIRDSIHLRPGGHFDGPQIHTAHIKLQQCSNSILNNTLSRTHNRCRYLHEMYLKVCSFRLKKLLFNPRKIFVRDRRNVYGEVDTDLIIF
jgi:hypothetical protein